MLHFEFLQKRHEQFGCSNQLVLIREPVLVDISNTAGIHPVRRSLHGKRTDSDCGPEFSPDRPAGNRFRWLLHQRKTRRQIVNRERPMLGNMCLSSETCREV